ncbi:hypothetical protein FD755_009796, partial [Muntiacus reevesi]
MGNHTRVVVFVLAGLTSDPQMKIVLFIFLLLTYLLSITGNLIIITLTLVDTHLKTPMYFFLRNFSFLEISYTTTCIPKLLVMMATGNKTISYNSCVTQVFFAFLLGASEFYLLAAMSYDRYVAICNCIFMYVKPSVKQRISFSKGISKIIKRASINNCISNVVLIHISSTFPFTSTILIF